MKIDASNLIYHDLVGLDAKVISSTDPSQLGIRGEVVDETANILGISTERGVKMIPKKNSSFLFYLPQEVTVEGSEIAFRPEDRLKRLQRRRR
jgi:ribonuclease P protein subunit POP4